MSFGFHHTSVWEYEGVLEFPSETQLWPRLLASRLLGNSMVGCLGTGLVVRRPGFCPTSYMTSHPLSGFTGSGCGHVICFGQWEGTMPGSKL